MNLFSYLFLLALFAGVLMQWLLVHRHIRHVHANRETVPAEFSDKITLADHRKAADYTRAKARLNLVDLFTGAVLVLIWTLGGGLQWVDTAWRSLQLPEIWTGTGFLLSIFAITSILGLPLSVYLTFGIEQRFGFNKMTPRLFIIDLMKNALLAVLIGTPLIMLVLWLMTHSGGYWWVYVWITWLGFTLLMVWVYPVLIAPLFNKFRPLDNTELKQRIVRLLSRNGFKSQGIFVMDGSSRSTHGNAYFTGLGVNKRIVFFDTLIDELSYDEIEAVLAHELGHFKCNHIVKRLTVLGLLFFAGLAILGGLIDARWFYQGLGVQSESAYMGLMLFVMVAPIFTTFLQPLFSFISRRHEFEADDFAAAQAHTDHLITALVTLYRENANTLTPDPLYSAFHDSHPPAPIRIAHLRGRPA